MTDKLNINGAIDKATSYMEKHKFDKARDVLEKEIKKVEEMGLYEDDDFTEYHSFNEKFEEMIYEEFSKPEKDVCNVSEPLGELYYLYGKALLELKSKKGAEAALQKAVRWNPVCSKYHLQIAELKRGSDYDGMLKATDEALKWAFSKEDMGNCFLYLGYYFDYKEAHEAAMGCYNICTEWGSPDNRFTAETFMISDKLFNEADIPTYKEMEKYAIQYNVPIAYNGKIVDFAIEQGKKAYSDRDVEKAHYLFSIVYEITDAENVRETLEQLQQMMDEE